MAIFSEKIKELASRRKWFVETRNDTHSNIQFQFSADDPLSSLLTFVMTKQMGDNVQFILTPGAYSVPSISRLPHDMSNSLLYRNSLKEGVWCVFEMTTPVGSKFFPGYARITTSHNLANTFDAVMDDIISEYDYLQSIT